VLIAAAPGLRIVDLHRPRALNALNHAMAGADEAPDGIPPRPALCVSYL
jgi:hypothetical protein